MTDIPTKSPLLIGIGGTAEPGSATEVALSLALAAARSVGAETRLFGGEALSALPHYLTPKSREHSGARALVECIRRADGVILASPGYHGSISGLVKNAIDYLEETSKDDRPYLHGLPVGLIATAYGWQAGSSTLAALRSIAHALRGWPTPYGATINSSGGILKGGKCSDAAVARQLAVVGEQVVELAVLRLGLVTRQLSQISA